jgi:hypothetical protein
VPLQDTFFFTLQFSSGKETVGGKGSFGAWCVRDYRAKRAALQFLQGALRRKSKQESRGVARREGERAAGKLSIFTEAHLRP